MERAGPERPTILPQGHNSVMYANFTLTFQPDQDSVRWLLFPFDNGYNHDGGSDQGAVQRDNPDTFTTAFLAQMGEGRKGKILSMA